MSILLKNVRAVDDMKDFFCDIFIDLSLIHI